MRYSVLGGDDITVSGQSMGGGGRSERSDERALVVRTRACSACGFNDMPAAS